MLVVAWDELYEAIPRIQAKEQLAAYSVAVVSSPYLTDEGQTARDRILDGWRNLVAQGQAWLKGEFKAAGSNGQNIPSGAKRDDSHFPPLRVFQQKLGEIIGRGMRD